MVSVFLSLAMLQSGPVRAQGIQISLPKNYIRIDANSPTFKKMMEKGVKANPALRNITAQVRNANYAVFAMDQTGLAASSAFVDNMNGTVNPSGGQPITAAVPGQLASMLPRMIPGIKVVQKKLVTLPIGPAAYVRATLLANTVTGAKIPIVTHTYVVSSKGKAVTLTYTNKQKSDASRAASIQSSVRSLKVL